MTILRRLECLKHSQQTHLTELSKNMQYRIVLGSSTRWYRSKTVIRLPDNQRPQAVGAERAQRGRAGRPQGLPPNFLRDPPYIGISVLFLRLVGLFPYGPCMAYSRYFMLFRQALVPLLPHNPWSLPQASLIGPKLGQAGGISRGAQSGPVNTLIIT